MKRNAHIHVSVCFHVAQNSYANIGKPFCGDIVYAETVEYIWDGEEEEEELE